MEFSRGSVLLCPLLIAACAIEPTYVPLPPTHPASPYACESPVMPPSVSLKVRRGATVPPNPDWQIPGMREDEARGHARGPMPTEMEHGMHGGMGKIRRSEPGMIKYEAPPGMVDYAPRDAYQGVTAVPEEHKPEVHLEHTDPQRRAAQPSQAPIAPPAGAGHEGHSMTGPSGQMDHPAHGAPAPAAATPAAATSHESHQAATPQHAEMDHSTNLQQETAAPAAATSTPTAAPADQEHQHH